MEQELLEAIRELTAEVKALNTFYREAQAAEETPAGCEHPQECLTDLTANGTGTKVLCNPHKGGCGYSEGFTEDELKELGL